MKNFIRKLAAEKDELIIVFRVERELSLLKVKRKMKNTKKIKNRLLMVGVQTRRGKIFMWWVLRRHEGPAKAGTGAKKPILTFAS